MSDKETKKKSKSVWWVLTQEDEVFVKHYGGPDRKRAREVAAKLLGDEKQKSQVLVAKIGRLAVLSESHLKRVLPKEAF